MEAINNNTYIICSALPFDNGIKYGLLNNNVIKQPSNNFHDINNIIKNSM
jgi:hypothetical protein